MMMEKLRNMKGHKRWEKAITTGYENIRRLAHSNLLPALERATVLVSRLLGLSKFAPSSTILGLHTQELTNVLDTIDCLNVLTHNTVIHSGTELRQFVAFSAWLRHQIDVQAAEPFSQTADELAEKDAMIDFPLVIRYVQGALTKSKLLEFFSPVGEGEGKPKWDPAAEGPSLYKVYTQDLRKHREAPETMNDLPKLSDFTAYLARQCGQVFKRIAETQRRSVLVSQPIMLGSDRDEEITDMRMTILESVCSLVSSSNSYH